MRSLRTFIAACLVIGLGGQARAADPIRIYAAGSLGAVLPKLIAASGLPEGAVATPVFGPAGLLRQRLVSGETADLFASADLAQPQAVAAIKRALVVPFARNRMCVLAPQRLGLTADNLLDRMLSPDLRLATSTLGADPGGDYARAVFARAEKLRPGAEQALIAKAKLLVGGPASMTPQPGHSAAATIFLTDAADALLYYCSGAEAAAKEVPSLVSLFPCQTIWR
jgi:ABC-type molybdate transport system substrate-binding protein